MELVDTSEEFSTMSGWQKFNHFVEFHVHELFKRNAPVGEGLERSLSRLSRCCGGRFVHFPHTQTQWFFPEKNRSKIGGPLTAGIFCVGSDIHAPFSLLGFLA